MSRMTKAARNRDVYIRNLCVHVLTGRLVGIELERELLRIISYSDDELREAVATTFAAKASELEVTLEDLAP